MLREVFHSSGTFKKCDVSVKSGVLWRLGIEK